MVEKIIKIMKKIYQLRNKTNGAIFTRTFSTKEKAQMYLFLQENYNDISNIEIIIK